jgi:hypothetical protein
LFDHTSLSTPASSALTVRPISSLSQPQPSRRKGLFAFAAIGIVAAGALVALSLVDGEDVEPPEPANTPALISMDASRQTPPPGPPDASQAKAEDAPLSVDAGVVAASSGEIVDAGVPDAEAMQPTVRATKTRPKQKRTTENRDVSADEFLARYREVRALIAELRSLGDKESASSLEEKFKNISPQSALREQELRNESYRKLQTLKKGARSTLRKLR